MSFLLSVFFVSKTVLLSWEYSSDADELGLEGLYIRLFD